jgi:hypothetical protein
MHIVIAFAVGVIVGAVVTLLVLIAVADAAFKRRL